MKIALPIILFLIVVVSVIKRYRKGEADTMTLILTLSGFGVLCGTIVLLLILGIL